MKAKDFNGWTPLHIACASGRTYTVEYLLKVDQHCINERTIDVSLPMHLALTNNHLNIMMILKQHNFVNMTDGCGSTFLHLSSTLDAFHFLDLADIGKKNYIGWIPLHVHSLKGNENIVSCIIKSPNININASDVDGFTPLHLPAEEGRLNIVQLLIKHCANFNAENKNGSKPLIALFTTTIQTLSKI